MIIFSAILGVIILILYVCYVRVIKAKNQLDEALSSIDTQLKLRSDSVPNILKIAQRFMKHEKELFTEITKLRSAATRQPVGTSKRFEAESKLQDVMKQFFVSVENYPQLKSDAPFTKAIESYTEIEENIAASRRFYNAALRELKDRTMIFPSSLFAGFAGDLSEYDYFKATAKEKKAINVDDYLK